jgi:hypothetical protein
MLGADLERETAARKERDQSASVPFPQDDLCQPRVQPRERVALLAQVIVSVVDRAHARVGVMKIAAKRLPITTEQDRSPPTSIRTKSRLLADIVAS